MNLKKLFEPDTIYYKVLLAISAITVTAVIGWLLVQAGSLNPTNEPTYGNETTWPHYPSLEDIYCKLNGTGCGSTAYTIDSSANPAATMHNLNEIWDATPDFKNSSGNAIAADVFRTKTFYTTSSAQLSGTLDLACGNMAGKLNGTDNKITSNNYSDNNANNRWCMGVGTTTGGVATDGGNATSSDLSNKSCTNGPASCTICCTAWVNGQYIIGSNSSF
jgi:hypothetical protein